MEKITINLGDTVYVTDPCYTVDVWCRQTLHNVLPGEYIAWMTGHYHLYGQRNTGVVVIHKDFYGKKKKWYSGGSIGVDSGQAGIFDAKSYRDDSIVESIGAPTDIDFSVPGKKEPGDLWYDAVTKFTLGGNAWGAYHGGIVSSSGFGDGMYDFKVLKEKSKIVGITIDFALTKTQKQFIDLLEENMV
jgi:hypothetical protein